jgi:hypothetical protein
MPVGGFSKGGWEMTGVLEQARERVESLQQKSAAMSGEAEGFLVFARENCSFVDHLSFIWTVMMHRLRCGGAPAKLFLEECDLLLTLISEPDRLLSHIARVWHQRTLPEELAKPVYAEVLEARNRLASLARNVREAREKIPQSPRVSADPEELKQRIKEADERQEWLPLRDVITRMRQNDASKGE